MFLSSEGKWWDNEGERGHTSANQGVRCPCGVCGVVGRMTSVALVRGSSRRPFGWRNENSSLHMWRHKNEHIHKAQKDPKRGSLVM